MEIQLRQKGDSWWRNVEFQPAARHNNTDVQTEIKGAVEILKSLRGEIAEGKKSANRPEAKIP